MNTTMHGLVLSLVAVALALLVVPAAAAPPVCTAVTVVTCVDAPVVPATPPPPVPVVPPPVPPPPPVPGATLRVCPAGCPYTLPSQAAAVAKDGNTIEIAAGTYANAATWTANNLTLRGVGGLAHLAGVTMSGKGIWIVKGANTTVENIEFSGAKVSDKNGAGIRYEGCGLTVRWSIFRDNENGILGVGGSACDVLIEYSRFLRNGHPSGQAHGLYIGPERMFTFRHNVVSETRGGHGVKSRALVNDISYNTIEDGATGASANAINLPHGGVGAIVGNLLQKGPRTGNVAAITFAPEGTLYPGEPAARPQELVIRNNRIVNDGPAQGTVVRVWGLPDVLLENNWLVGPWVIAATPVTSRGNVLTTDPMLADTDKFDPGKLAGSGVAGPPPVMPTLKPDPTPPTTPPAFAAVATPGAGVLLTWDPAADNRGVAGYRALRDGKVVGTAGLSARDFLAENQPTAAAYSVSAFDAAGNTSAPSALASVTPLPVEVSPLAALAGSMPRGSWAELSTLNMKTLVAAGSNLNIFTSAQGLAYDPRARNAWFVGQDYGNTPPETVRFSVDANAWTGGPRRPWVNGVQHPYDGQAIDPATGDLYYLISNREIVRLRDGKWESVALLPISQASFACCLGMAWFPELGSLIVANPAAYAWKAATGVWSLLGKVAMGKYNYFAEYNPVHRGVWLGGGSESLATYWLDAAGKLTQLKDAPVTLSTNVAVVSVDPVSGLYLIVTRAKEFYTYDVVADVWTLQPPPPTSLWTHLTGVVSSLVATPLSDVGVTLWAGCAFRVCKVHLYKQ